MSKNNYVKKVGEKSKGLFSEFKAFIQRGNAFDLAVAVVIGNAFNAIVTSLVNDIMMPLIAAILGEHDFSAFCANKKMKKSTVRYIRSIEIRRCGQEIQIDFTGNGFLHNMVRILVGTLVEVGRGQREAASVAELFGGKRSEAGFLAPPQGLCLEEVFY